MTRKYVLVFFSILVVWFLGVVAPASAATIYGTVTDSNGPVADVRVGLSRVVCTSYGYVGKGCTLWSPSTYTATDGTYSFVDIFLEDPIDEYTVVVANISSSLYAYQSKEAEITEEVQSVQVNFEIELASTISGTLHRADGTLLTADELEKIKVQLYQAEGGIFFPYFASVESDGRYTLSGLPSGRSFNVSVRGDGTVNYILEWSTGAVSVPDPLELTGAIEITSPGSQIDGVNFQLDSGATIEGKIYSNAEMSAYSYKVIVTGSTAEDACSLGLISITSDSIESVITTDYYVVDVQEDGSYAVTGLRPGSYYAKSYHYGDTDEWLTGINTDSSPNCQQAERLIVTSAEPEQVFEQRNFQVGTGGNISGTVFQADGQTPVDGAYRVRFQESCTTVGDEPEVTTVSGQYTSPVLPAGDYFLDLLNEAGEFVGWRTASGALSADCADAVAIHVDEDQTRTGVDFIVKERIILTPVYQMLLLK